MKKQKRNNRKRANSPFSENLKQVLTVRKLTQRAIAELAGVQVSVVNSWMSGAVASDPIVVLKLAKALNLDYQFLMTGEYSNFKPEDLTIDQVFRSESDPAWSGIFQIEAKRLVLKSKK